MYKSKEELYFSWYLDELLAKGYIESYVYEPETFPLTDGLKLSYEVEVIGKKKTTTKIKEKTILEPSTYTVDFKVTWLPKAIGILVSEFNNYKGTYYLCNDKISYIEIKGNYDSNNMSRLARSNIKFLYHNTKIYVNLVKVPDVFKNTFTPEKYLFTDKNKVLRKINFKTTLLQ